MKKRDNKSANLQTIQSVITHDDLLHRQLPADYNAMQWDEFFAIFKTRQPALYNKFVNK